MIKKLLVFVALLLVAASLSGAIYKWVDDRGITHYAQKPPPRAKAAVVDIDPKAPPTLTLGPEDNWQEQDQEYQNRRAQQQNEEREAAEIAQRGALMNHHRCISARTVLDNLASERPIYSLNENGERSYIDDATRAVEIERAKKDIRESCPPASLTSSPYNP